MVVRLATNDIVNNAYASVFAHTGYVLKFTEWNLLVHISTDRNFLS